MNEIQRAGEQVKSVLLKQRNLIYAICIGKSRKGTSAKYQFLYPKGQVLIDLTKPLAILTGHTYEDGLAVIKSGDPQHLLKRGLAMTVFCNPTYDDMISGRAVWVDGVAYHRTHTVSYSQQGVSHSKSYASEDAARSAFESALREDRQCWSRCPNGYIETDESTEWATVVRFRSRLKNGKPGKLSGIRMLHATK